jgi:hypothetical protein
MRPNGKEEVIVDITRPEAESAEKQKHWIKIRKKMKLSVLISHRDAGEGVAGLSSSDDSPAAVVPTLSAKAKYPPPPPGAPAKYAQVSLAKARHGRGSRIREAVKIVKVVNETAGLLKFMMSDERRPSPVSRADDSEAMISEFEAADRVDMPPPFSGASSPVTAEELSLVEYSEPDVAADVEAPPVKD